LHISLVLGLLLAFIYGTELHFGAKIFTKDVYVFHLIQIGIPIIIGFLVEKDTGNPSFQHLQRFTFLFVLLSVCGSRSILKSLAFVFDGVNFGASNFAYLSFSMVGFSSIF